jgi:outer membrane lipoprotein-sorting protein
MKTMNCFMIAVLLFNFTQLFAQSAREISEKSSNAIKFEAMEMSVKLYIFDSKGNQRERTILSASKKFNQVTKTLMKFTAPAEVKGTTMLIYDYEDKTDNMWLYMPALRKTRRIISSEKSKSFMGSEFTHADMSSPNLEDFSYKILGSTTYQGEECWKIESSCKNEDIEDENGFSRKIAWINKKNNLCYKITFYDFDGELYKTQTIGNYKKQKNGKYFAYSMTAKNHQNGRKSVISIQEFQIGSSLNENTFSPNTLGN